LLLGASISLHLPPRFLLTIFAALRQLNPSPSGAFISLNYEQNLSCTYEYRRNESSRYWGIRD